jgi:hypothetical protein
MNESGPPKRPEWMNLSDEFESAIRRMIVTFVHLEGNLRSVTCGFVGGDREKVLALVSSLDFRKLVSTLPGQIHLITKNTDDIARIKTWASTQSRCRRFEQPTRRNVRRFCESWPNISYRV